MLKPVFTVLTLVLQDVTLIDFPQMVSMRHHNAEDMFDRDVHCIVKYFTMKMKWTPPADQIPR